MLRDVFPQSSKPKILDAGNHPALRQSVEETLIENNLQPNEDVIQKVIKGKKV